MAAVYAGVAALVGVRAWENVKGGQSNAEVEKVRATANPPPAEALKPAVAADGELPEDQRVKL